MKLRRIAAGTVVAIAASTGAGITLSGGPANASGSTIETSSQTKVMLSVNCYETYKREVIYYTHSVTKGWVPEPSPKVETTKSETCDK